MNSTPLFFGGQLGIVQCMQKILGPTSREHHKSTDNLLPQPAIFQGCGNSSCWRDRGREWFRAQCGRKHVLCSAGCGSLQRPKALRRKTSAAAFPPWTRAASPGGKSKDFSTKIRISVCTSIEHPTVQDGFGSAVSWLKVKAITSGVFCLCIYHKYMYMISFRREIALADKPKKPGEGGFSNSAVSNHQDPHLLHVPHHNAASTS